MMSEVPPQWKGPAIKANATVDVTQAASEIKELLGAEEEALAEEAAAPEMTFEPAQHVAVAPAFRIILLLSTTVTPALGRSMLVVMAVMTNVERSLHMPE